MDGQKFDAVVRRLAERGSRRDAVRGGVAGLLAAIGALRVGGKSALADHCSYVGCGCATGTRHPCDRGLVCCPSSPGVPGAGGVCSSPGDCGGSCNGDGAYCGDSCNWGDSCPACCSGYCGSTGACASASCSGLGCACSSGTFQPCDGGLVCCSSYDFPGAQGSCQYSCA